MIKYNAIVLPDKVYISDSRSVGYSNFDLSDFIFDCGEALKTNKKGWYELPFLPKTVQKMISPPRVVSSYILKSGFVPTDKLPHEVPADYFEYDDDEKKRIHLTLYFKSFKLATHEHHT